MLKEPRLIYAAGNGYVQHFFQTLVNILNKFIGYV